MAKAAAAYLDINAVSSRGLTREDCRRAARAVGRHLVFGLAAAATVALMVVGATAISAWIVNTTVATSPQLHGKGFSGPAKLALIDHQTGGATVASLERPWARAATADTPFVRPRIVEVPQSHMRNPARAARAVASIPLPRPYPHARQIAQLPEKPAAPVREVAQLPEEPMLPTPAQIAAIAPALPPSPPATMEKRAVPHEAHNRAPALPEPDSRTAIYDISARTVYLPNGKKLEAHSGLGSRMDDPREAHVRMRGPTPPNVYDLTLRERLFHGVQAIRLNPVDESKMFGRDGMLAHSYMLGPNGQSNGCVSFKNYQAFLDAYLKGEIDRLVVVPNLGDTSWRTVAMRPRPPRRDPVRREPVRRYASSAPVVADPRPFIW